MYNCKGFLVLVIVFVVVSSANFLRVEGSIRLPSSKFSSIEHSVSLLHYLCTFKIVSSISSSMCKTKVTRRRWPGQLPFCIISSLGSPNKNGDTNSARGKGICDILSITYLINIRIKPTIWEFLPLRVVILKQGINEKEKTLYTESPIFYLLPLPQFGLTVGR